MKEANRVGMGWAHAGGTGLFRNVPTCDIVEAPGIFTAIMRAAMLVTDCARAACEPESPSTNVMPAAKVTMLAELTISLQKHIGLWTCHRQCATKCDLCMRGLR